MVGDKLGCNDIAALLKTVAAEMQKKYVKQLRDLDAEIGDGDLGITVQKGFRAVEELLSNMECTKSGISAMLKEIGTVFSEANPSTFSAFFATAFRKAAVVAKEKQRIDMNDVVNMFEAASNGIMKLGKAKQGDKTLLDALVPAAKAFQKAAQSGGTFVEGFRNATFSAKQGMEHTKELQAMVGRARSFGARTVGVQDAGATFVYLFLDEVTRSLSTL
jgi:dihydroxyacetone kinase-like protein